MWIPVVFVLVAVGTEFSFAEDLKVGAFNPNILGPTKAGKPDVMDALAKIIRLYDFILLQELRDITEGAINDLLDLCNLNNTTPFTMLLSERLGRSSQKEQYAYLYKESSGLSIVSSYVFNDTDDIFEREPLCAKVESNYTVLKSFGVCGIHTKPTAAKYEVANLTLVVDDMLDKFGIPDCMIMGDYNADCNYISQTFFSTMEYKINETYTWWISDAADTTTKTSDCAYDRFVTVGDGWTSGIVPGSAIVDRFDLNSDIIGQPPNQTFVELVSDHFPIQFLLAQNTTATNGTSCNCTCA